VGAADTVSGMFAGRFLRVGEPVIGGMATVWKAYDAQGQFGEVALKVLSPGSTDFHRRAFEREHRALLKLRHPNVVELLHGGIEPESGEPFLVFPWLERRLQEEMVSELGQDWETWWSTIGRPILDALEAAHGLELHHRDLKPANVMLGPNGEPRIIDFGISKMSGLLAPEATVDGASAPFTPREPVSDSPAMTRDTHAWAALAVFALSGLDPYPPGTSDRWEVLDRARHEAMPKLPPEIRSVIERCLSQDPSLRPAHAGALAAELRRVGASARRRRSSEDGPRLHVVITDHVAEAMEGELDIYSADVIDVLRQELAGEVFVAPTPQAGWYLLIASTMSVRVAVHERDSVLMARSLALLPAQILDRDRARGWPLELGVTIGRPSDRTAAAAALREFQQQAGEHALLSKGSGTDRPRAFVVWRALLSMLRAYESTNEDPVEYRRPSMTPKGLKLELPRGASELAVGEVRVAPGVSGPVFEASVLSVTNDYAVLRGLGEHVDAPRERGELRRDRRRAQAAIDRQFRAIDAVEYGRAVRPDLAELLAVPGRAAEPTPVDDLFFALDLDERKQDAVARALGTSDLLVVQGPPGTGKTRFITELILQELDRDESCRILLASQSHAALDHALSGVEASGRATDAVRIAPTDLERVAVSSHELMLDQRVARWRSEAIRSGERWLAAWAKTVGIDVAAVRAAGLLRVLSADLRRLRRLDDDQQVLASRVAEVRGARSEPRQGSTVAQALRDVEERLSEVRDDRAICADEVKAHITELIALRQLPSKTSARQLDPEQLEQKARDLLPTDERAARECEEILGLLSDWHERFGLGPAFRAAVLARAQLVAATCVGLAGQRGADGLEFDIAIVDEASKATAPELLIPLSRARRIVLVGDERQLPPYIEQSAIDAAALEERDITAEEVKEPLFAALARDLPAKAVLMLRHQHRMHPAIGELVSRCFYGGQLTSEPREVAGWLSMIGPRPVTWLTTTGLAHRREERPGGGSVRNLTEVSVIATLLNTMNGLASAADQRPTVAVLTGYTAQREAVAARIAPQLAAWSRLSIQCQTVDAFQGQEADIVIYSLTRSNTQRKLGFVRERPRINVAMSRARDALFIVGDHSFARQARGAEDLRKVIEHIELHADDCCLISARVS
jgi:hypothetical protein